MRRCPQLKEDCYAGFSGGWLLITKGVYLHVIDARFRFVVYSKDCPSERE